MVLVHWWENLGLRECTKLAEFLLEIPGPEFFEADQSTILQDLVPQLPRDLVCFEVAFRWSWSKAKLSEVARLMKEVPWSTLGRMLQTACPELTDFKLDALQTSVDTETIWEDEGLAKQITSAMESGGYKGAQLTYGREKRFHKLTI